MTNSPAGPPFSICVRDVGGEGGHQVFWAHSGVMVQSYFIFSLPLKISHPGPAGWEGGGGRKYTHTHGFFDFLHSRHSLGPFSPFPFPFSLGDALVDAFGGIICVVERSGGCCGTCNWFKWGKIKVVCRTQPSKEHLVYFKTKISKLC